MTDLPPPSPEERDEDLAVTAEYVLGLLEPAEVAAFEARLAVDPEFRSLVARWSDDFATLLDAAPAEAPPPRVEAALQRRLFPEERQSWLRRLGIVPALVGGLAAAMLLLWVSDLGLLRPLPEGPAFQANLTAEGSPLVVAARFTPGAETLEIERSAGAAPEGRVLELWLIPEGGEGTAISLGLLPDDAPTAVIAVPEALRPQVATAVLAITDEPPGGAPGGVATGGVLAAGPVTAL